ncbi:TfoX/Sxy family DNA transformation protein [Bacillus sp. CLL-7-23]|uniref:TfoX/Sxy family DNA transformation protein n=1 Tax=Bacillus changyiensis TaxID=3004103 RepID=A0ABT4X3S3_9BACI|nr:TfoX/Sxy family DNA transformation protein [Bacillus changyiensis]MDA7026757.1 TfoX/Sxy family DNA transformation protein [Bacillus changyiensis]
MKRISELPNIGDKLKERLAAVGIEDAETLIKMGSKVAFSKLYFYEGDTCFNCLCSLEGAIQGVRWHSLKSDVKLDLKQYYHSII